MKTTSHIAYESILPHLGNMHKTILEGLQKLQSGTFREIAKTCNLRDDQVWKRLSELEKKGLITSERLEHCTISGRLCTVWKLNENNN